MLMTVELIESEKFSSVGAVVNVTVINTRWLRYVIESIPGRNC